MSYLLVAASDASQEILCNSDVQQSIVGDNTNAYINMKTILKEIKVACGNICLTNDDGVKGKYYNAIWKDFECKELFSQDIFDR